MNKPITKLATAAVIIIGLGMAVHLIDKATTPAWAIDQSIDAMKNYRGICFSGTISLSWEDFFKNLGVQDLPELPESRGEFEMWAQADEELSRSSLVKIICPDNIIISGRKLQAYIQLADGTTYDIQGDIVKIDPWPTFELLKILKENTNTWTELHGRDAETGKERIFIKCSSSDRNKSWKLEFDSESKLLVSLRQWDKSDNHEGLPTFDIWKIVYYEQLPDDIFEIDLPDSTDIIAVNTPLYDPDYGMSTEGLTEEQACKKILEEFWQAIINDDLARIRQLLPIAADWEDEILICNLGLNEEDEIVELLEIGHISHETTSGFGPAAVVPSIVKCKDGKTREIKMIILFRQIDGQSSCVIYANSGKVREID